MAKCFSCRAVLDEHECCPRCFPAHPTPRKRTYLYFDQGALAGVVVATSPEDAAALLILQIAKKGLTQYVNPDNLHEVNTLQDGVAYLSGDED